MASTTFILPTVIVCRVTLYCDRSAGIGILHVNELSRSTTCVPEEMVTTDGWHVISFIAANAKISFI